MSTFKKRLAALWGLIVLGSLCGAPQAAEQPLRLCQNGPGFAYRLAVANLILAKTADAYGARSLAPSTAPNPSQERCLASLKSGLVDFAFVPPTPTRLHDFDVLPIDMYNGLLSYRLLIVRAQDLAIFAHVQSLEDLRQFTGGFGSQWADFSLFALNGLPVQGMANTGILLAMLDQQRFDYYQRGLPEAWSELTDHNEYPGLAIEPHLALEYFLPVYFVFNKNDALLRQRFQEGFSIIEKDGSFKALLDQYFGQMVARTRLSQRTIIRLKTPMPSELPAPDASFWLDQQPPGVPKEPQPARTAAPEPSAAAVAR